jgi:hypothetical protein
MPWPIDAMRERAEAFERFAAWEAAQPVCLSPAAAVEAVGSRYELLPPSSQPSSRSRGRDDPAQNAGADVAMTALDRAVVGIAAVLDAMAID